jgi:hypothetical protein
VPPSGGRLFIAMTLLGWRLHKDGVLPGDLFVKSAAELFVIDCASIGMVTSHVLHTKTREREREREN